MRVVPLRWPASPSASPIIDHNDLEAMTEEVWDRILAINWKGPFFVIRAAAGLLRADDASRQAFLDDALRRMKTGASAHRLIEWR